MKQLHFTKHGRGQLYVCDEGNYRFQVYRVSGLKPPETWAASVHPRNAKRPSCLDRTFAATKAEAIDWCSKRNKLLTEAAVSKAEQRKAGVKG